MPAVISVFTHKAALKQTQILTIRNNCFLGEGLLRDSMKSRTLKLLVCCCFESKIICFLG